MTTKKPPLADYMLDLVRADIPPEEVLMQVAKLYPETTREEFLEANAAVRAHFDAQMRRKREERDRAEQIKRLIGPMHAGRTVGEALRELADQGNEEAAELLRWCQEQPPMTMWRGMIIG